MNRVAGFRGNPCQMAKSRHLAVSMVVDHGFSKTIVVEYSNHLSSVTGNDGQAVGRRKDSRNRAGRGWASVGSGK